MLYLIATPIGNLGDISLRALETMRECDYLLCEDTRHTRILCNHYEIKIPLKSFHLFNEKAKENWVIEELKEGKNIGLVSDAGMPTLNDPGSKLIARCQQEEVSYSVIPGASSILTAMAGSGFIADKFQFIGFFPKKNGKRKKILEDALTYPGVTIAFESPYRLLKLLEQLKSLAPEREIVIARELTKKFETILRGTCEELLTHFQLHPLKGEIVFIISEGEN